MNSGLIILIVVIGLLILLRKVIMLYLTVQFAQVDITFGELVGMLIRKVDMAAVVNSYIVLKKSQINVKLIEIEVAILSGRNIKNITEGLLTAKKNNIPLTFDQAKKADENGTRISDEILKNINN